MRGCSHGQSAGWNRKSGDLPVIAPSVHYSTEVKSCLDEQCWAGDTVRLGENSEIRSGYAIPAEDCEVALG